MSKQPSSTAELPSASCKANSQFTRLSLSLMDDYDTKYVNALASSYSDRIRPLLDAVDRLRQLKVMQEGIELPTIVVVGDQSSGKSSVLESLAGISLPRGQGICTRAPLIMRLQDHPSSLADPQLHLEYRDKTVATTESGVTSAINAATDEIAGSGKGISNIPLTLVVKKKGVPDLTMVDLPGITRVPVHGQPENIYEQITNIIKEYITPKESIILNVLSATVDFPTCESIRMSQQVDPTGERTLAVVTKADKAPEGLLEKVTADDFNIGLGYICVRNRVGYEAYTQARVEETTMFDTHPLLSRIDKSIVGIPVLAQKLMQIQAASITKCLPGIVKKINEKLSRNMSELDQMPQNLNTVADAMRAYMHMISSWKEYLQKILIRGEFDDFPDDLQMHGTARLAELLDNYCNEFPSNCPYKKDSFLMEEIDVLLENKGIGLPNFLPRTAFLTVLKRKVGIIAHTPRDFIRKVWDYVEDVLLRVLIQHSDNYPQLQSSTKRAAENLIEKKRSRSYKFVKDMIEMELTADYTSNPDYMKTWKELMEKQDEFMGAIQKPSAATLLNLGILGMVEVGHLRQHTAMVDKQDESVRATQKTSTASLLNLRYLGMVKVGNFWQQTGTVDKQDEFVRASLVGQAFDMRMRMTAYWRTVVLRLVDGLVLHVLHSIKNLVEHELETEMVTEEIIGPRGTGIKMMLEELPSTANKREGLNRSIQLLKESKKVVTNIMDRIAAHGD